MLYIVIISAVVLVVSSIIQRRSSYGFWDSLSLPFQFFSGFALGISLFLWPMIYYGSLSNVEVYHATKQTITEARKEEMSEMERVALSTKIIEMNSQLAGYKFWNRAFLGDVVPDELAELEYLK